MKLTLGFSPCPNDTFIFDALVNRRIDTGDLEFETVLADVQTLNEWAMQGKLDVTKISYGVLPLVSAEYDLLHAGGALGKGVGPLLIAKKAVPPEDISGLRIAIPGRNTTANLLFSLAFPEARRKDYIVFSDIEQAVLNEDVDAGVIIHENRFTYQEKGLIKIRDLGEYWEEKTGAPIPLGGIVMRRSWGEPLQQKVNALIRQSLERSFAGYPRLSEYVKKHSQEMDESVMRQHIDLYVNDYSLDIGVRGRAAIDCLMDVYNREVGAGGQMPSLPSREG